MRSAFRCRAYPGGAHQRCQKGSANRAKVRVKVARAHARVTDARRDFLHKTSTGLVHRFDVIAVEDLQVRNRHLARAISCTGWAQLRSMVEYKAARYGRTVIVVDRWHPSSKTCSGCGHLLTSLSLGTRQWTCPACGARHDRDINAAKNILAAGLAVYACGGDVRRAGGNPDATASETGIPTREGRNPCPLEQGRCQHEDS